ncbi:MAG: right-handed parallel beta-helix repeat-containing protein, partial [Maribacter dokdonensis]
MAFNYKDINEYLRIMIRPTSLKNTLFFFTTLLLFTCLFQSCASEKDHVEDGNTTHEQSEEPKITAFSFLTTDNNSLTSNIAATLDEEKKTIYVELDPLVLNIDQLIPTITLSSGSTVSPISKSEQDFSHEVTYTVTAENGTTTVYKVVPSIIGNICTSNLVDSSPIVVHTNNQRIENLYIRTTDQHGIEINNHTGVVISNCIIEYTGAYMGIKFTSADNLTIKNCYIKYTNAPSSGPLADSERNCIEGIGSKNIVIANVK